VKSKYKNIFFVLSLIASLAVSALIPVACTFAEDVVGTEKNSSANYSMLIASVILLTSIILTTATIRRFLHK
jgi:uncharacterized membrane protein (DUF485 family)